MLVRALPRVQVVVIATGALPFEVPEEASVKFTVAGLAETVRDSARTAFRLTVAVFEFKAWAFDAWLINAASPKTASIILNLLIAFMMPPYFPLRGRSDPQDFESGRPTHRDTPLRMNSFSWRL